MKKLFCCIAFLMWFSSASATVYIDCDFDSAPSSESQGGIYTCATGSMDLFYGSNQSGSVFDHETGAACWEGTGGCAKFYRFTTGTNAYRALQPQITWNQNTQNIRFLMKIQTASDAFFSGKWLYTGDGVGTWDTYLGMGTAASPLTEVSITMCYDWTICVHHEDGKVSPSYYEHCSDPTSWGSGIEDCTEVVTGDRWDWTDYVSEWVAIEQEKNFTTGTMSIYVWTQDGVWSGKIFEVDTTYNNTDNSRNSAIGAYMENAGAGDNWFMIDEVVYSDSYIGPPAGFVTGASDPTSSTASGTVSLTAQ